MYDEDKYNNRSQKALDKHVRDEIAIYSQDIYQELRAQYSNEEDMTIYRGINFSSRLAYHRFMKSLEKDGGYIQSSASSFAVSKETAADFSETTKTYYPTKEVIAAESERRKTGEKLSGYCGVILTAQISKGEAVDVCSSDFGIEDEILMEPNKLIKVEVEVINSLKYQVNQSNFDINEYIQNCKVLSDPLFQYITINKADQINNDSASHIFDLCIPTKKEKDSVIEKRMEKKDSEDLIHNGMYLTVIKDTTWKSWKDDTEVKKHYFFTPRLIAEYEQRGCLRPEQYKKLEKVANDILVDTMEVYYNEGQNILIENLNQVSWFAKFANSTIQEIYEKSILRRRGREYQDMEKEMSGINQAGLSNEEKRKKIDEYSENITELLNSISKEKITPQKRQSKRLSGQKK
ncbi:MAG: hypothetical protein GY828_07025 [Candidatus Gracilibacteria bacterium]|nr:hypothetical protein [Candidatus Gracilibacteria bacterium]